MTEDKGKITMVQRAIEILNYLEKTKGPAGVSEISLELSLPKATTHRILMTLLDGQMVRKTEEDKYLLGLAVIRLASKVSLEQDFKSLARPYLRELAQKTGETVNLGMLNPKSPEIIYLLNERGEENLLMKKLLPVSDLHCSSGGKLALSEWSESACKEFFKGNLAKRTLHTKLRYEDIKEELQEIREKGYAMDVEEYEYGLTCVAYPIRKKNGELYATISLSGPSSRVQFKGMKKLRKELKNTAKSIEEELHHYDEKML